MITKKVCVVVGVGPGNGAALGRRFAKEGYAVALLARTTETSGPLATSLVDARAYSCDVTEGASVARTFEAIEREIGPVHTLVYNAGSGIWGTIEDIDPAGLDGAFGSNEVRARKDADGADHHRRYHHHDRGQPVRPQGNPERRLPTTEQIDE